MGNVDAGKSTLLGVLTHSELDNGRGHARQRLFRHKHEMESGRTSSVGNDILGKNMNCTIDLKLNFNYETKKPRSTKNWATKILIIKS